MVKRIASSLCLLLTWGISLSSNAEPPDTPVPGTADPNPSSVRELLSRDEWQTALELARKCHAARIGEDDGTAVLGEALFRAGMLHEVSGLLEPLLDGDTPPSRALITLARLYHARGRFDEVESPLTAAVSGAPTDAELMYIAGDLSAGRARTIDLLNRYLELTTGGSTPRVESARGTIRFLEQLGDRAIWTVVTSPERVELPLTMLWDSAGNTLGYVVEAKIGAKGKRVRLLLDTGSSGLLVIDRIARKRGFELLAQGKLFGGGGTGVHQTGRGLFPAFELGGLRFENALATTTRQELEPTGRYHGLIGLNIFDGYQVTLDFAKKRLILEANREPSSGDPYWWITGQLLVRVEAAQGSSGLFILDTGAAISVLSRSFVDTFESSRSGEDVELRVFGGTVAGAQLVKGVEIAYQGFTTGTAGLVVTDMSLPSRVGGVEVSGLLGLDLLAGKRLVFDTTSRHIELIRSP